MKALKAIRDSWPRTLLAIYVVALLSRVAFIWFLDDRFYFPDSLSYTRAAGNLLAYGEFGATYRRAPGYAVFLAAIQTVFGNSIFAVRLIESFLGAVLAVMIAILGRRLGGAAVGAVAGALWGLYPMGIFIVGLVYPTALMALLLAIGACFVLPQPRQALSSKRVFLGGLVWGVGALIVPAGLATIGLTTVWLLYWGGTKRFALAALLLLGSAVALVPWTVRNYSVHGRVVAVDARMENHLVRTTGSADDEEDKIAAIRRNPALFAINAAKEFVYFWRLYPERLGMTRQGVQRRYYPDSRLVRENFFTLSSLTTVVSVATTLPLFIFATIGTMTMLFHKERRRDLSLLWTIILSFAFGYSLFFTKLRYRVPIEPYIMILSACGVVDTWRFFSTRYLSGLLSPVKTSTHVQYK